ncbi:MAG: CHASE2 domain-containing protein, partial [Treponema sp.]|nr:CHASE2 domain-containing protein [Treponema sp.]
MKKIRKKTNKKIAALTIIVVVFAAISLLHLCGAFHYLEYKSYDLRVRLFASSVRPSDDIIVILVDQDSIDWAQRERQWYWPWPRKAYAEIVDYMNLGGANAVAFDIIYSEPSLYQAEDDEAFIRAEREYGRAVQGVFFSSQTGSVRSWPPELKAPLFETAGFGRLLEQFSTGGTGNRLEGAQFPIQGLRDAAGALGCLTGAPDSDSVIRRLRLFTLFDDKAVPGLAAALLLASGHSPGISFDSPNRTIQWGNFSVPVDKNGASLLRFRGDLSCYFPVSAKDVLLSYEAYQNGEEPLYPPEDFAGTYVFIGLY